MSSSTFLSIGDTVCDAFIELIDAHITCKIDTSNCELCMKFGDKLPFKQDILLYGVGNSANAAVSLSRLGSPSGLITHLGDDDNGIKSLESLEQNKVTVDLVVKQQHMRTNYHYVLWYPPERTILVNHQHYIYDFPTEIQNLNSLPHWVYLSSLGGGTEQYHNDIATWLKARPEIKLVFQPGTFQMNLGVEKLQSIYTRSELFFCNVEESIRILGSAGTVPPETKTTEEKLRYLLSEMRALGPAIVVITDGPNGAYSYDGTTYRYCPMYPDIAPPLERTGAGDAYASTFSKYYADGLSVPECMLRAPINSMSVVQQVGAQAGLLTEQELQHYLDIKPTEYKIREF